MISNGLSLEKGHHFGGLGAADPETQAQVSAYATALTCGPALGDGHPRLGWCALGFDILHSSHFKSWTGPISWNQAKVGGASVANPLSLVEPH